MTAPISVIVPTYNRLTTLPRALHSVTQQTLKPQEIIVIDDGSTDNTLGWLNKWHPPGIDKVVIRQRRSGVSRARNVGLEKASSPWIALLDSDDEWLPHKLKAQMYFVETHTDVFIIHTEEIWMRRGIRVNPHKKHQKMGGHIYLQCLPLCLISPSSVLLHQSIFKQIGRFDEALPAGEDYDLWLRVTSQFEVGFISQPCLIKYGGHRDQLSRQYPAMDQYRVQALIKMLAKDNLKKEYRQKTLAMLQKKCHILIGGAKKRGQEELAKKHWEILKRYALTYPQSFKNI